MTMTRRAFIKSTAIVPAAAIVVKYAKYLPGTTTAVAAGLSFDGAGAQFDNGWVFEGEGAATQNPTATPRPTPAPVPTETPAPAYNKFFPIIRG